MDISANLLQADLDAEVIIVGGGPAGATAAYYLAKAGHRVTLLDRQTFPRDKVCGDFVGPASIKELQDIGITELADFKAANAIETAAVFLDGEELISTPMPKLAGMAKNGLVIPRKTLDAWLFNAARRAGATTIENVLVTGFQVEKETVKVTSKTPQGSRIFHAKLLIGADGSNSLIAQGLRGYAPPRTSRIVGIRGYFENVQGLASQADMHFSSDSFPGYCWLFPTGNTQANIGVGVLLEAMPKSQHPKELLTELISHNKGLKQRLKEVKQKGALETWPINTYNPNLPIVGDRVILVGEAAGLVNPLNGEGIQYALLSGKWAAETAQLAISNHDFSLKTLSSYSSRVNMEMGEGFKVSALLIQLLRNRNLNPLWLGAFETIVARARSDPEFAETAGLLLSGMVPTNYALDAKFLASILEQAAVSSELKIIDDAIRDPSTLPDFAIKTTLTGFKIVYDTVQDPFGFLKWGMETGSQMAEYMAQIPLQMLQGLNEKNKPQPSLEVNKPK